MTKKVIGILLITLLFGIKVYAQKSAVYTSNLVDYQKALTLYNNKQYLAAQNLFKTIENQTTEGVLKSDCAYYAANCAVRLNQQNADDLIECFVENYPTSTKRNTAFIDVADYYFENSKYARARKWYDKVDETSLSLKEREKFSFNYGYSNYSTKNYKGAKKYLSRVENSITYGSQAKYYIGFMAYQDDDYTKATEYFQNIENNDKYREKLSYYQADLNFKLGNFQKAIDLAKAQLSTSNAIEISELSKIIGESYFNLKKYSEAIPYLTDYKGKKGKWNNTDYYQLGYAFYKQKNYDKAISEFNKIIDGNNKVAQNAYYHLGESYVNVNKKQQALNTFRNASQMDFDAKIQEDAWLNYAKLSYEIGNPYQSVSQVLSAYIERYPKSSFIKEIEDLLIDSYITSKNYKDALELLDGKNSFENKKAFQKVAFYRAIELYNQNKYSEAKELFQKSLNQPIDDYFTTRSTFWKAETNYNLSNYEDALIGFKQFKDNAVSKNTPEITTINYNIAYTYFKQKQYTQATSFFKEFLNTATDDRLRKNDAYLRLGDGYFVSSNYNDAINAYSDALNINEIESDYAAFQKAMCYGYLGKSDTKILELENFVSNYSSSSLADDALYELGNSYVKKKQTEKAMQKYNQLYKQYAKSPFVSKALLRQGLVHYNNEQNNDALLKFKKVAKEYPGTPEAMQAVSSARLVYIDLGQVNAYASWVKTLGYVDVTNADLDNTAYEAAEKQYLENNSNKAIKQFNAYLSSFPKGLHATKAHFYLAQLYYKDNLKDNALPHYQYVIEVPSNEFTETALAKTSEIILNNKNWSEAIPVLSRLETESGNPQNIVFAQSNLMKANYQLKQYNEAVIYAEKVLSNSKVDKNIQSDAHVIIARSAFSTGNQTKAQQAYAQVEAIASGELAAEALFYNAYFKNKAGEYEASNTVVQKLAKDHSAYKYYAAKGLVVMAKNFNALEDAYQATYILESVIENFSQFEDVITEAKTTLGEIKTEQAKTNSSVETQAEGN